MLVGVRRGAGRVTALGRCRPVTIVWRPSPRPTDADVTQVTTGGFDRARAARPPEQAARGAGVARPAPLAADGHGHRAYAFDVAPIRRRPVGRVESPCANSTRRRDKVTRRARGWLGFDSHAPALADIASGSDVIVRPARSADRDGRCIPRDVSRPRTVPPVSAGRSDRPAPGEGPRRRRCAATYATSKRSTHADRRRQPSVS